MYKQYLRQAVYLLKDNKLLSAISVLGTALAIAMIMCIVLVYTVRTANYKPEVNRDRTLIVKYAIAERIGQEGWKSGGSLSQQTIKECFYPLTKAEAVTAVFPLNTRLATIPGGTTDVKCNVSGTDDSFWNVFRFRFLSGKPYSEEYSSGVKTAVVCRSIARRLFGTEDVVGKTISLSYVHYTICGVVEDVSILSEMAYADVWVPYPTLSFYDENREEGLLGNFHCFVLAPDKNSLSAVREEALANIQRMNKSKTEFVLNLYGAPDTQLMSLARTNIFTEPNVAKLIATYCVVIAILLLVPAINLSGITLSRMRRRMEEIGVRRAFGATRSELMVQVLSENFLLTLLGGLFGLILSYLGVLGLREWLLNTTMSGYAGVGTQVDPGMMLSPEIFLYAFLFCLFMNVLSAGIPAWRTANANIIVAINRN